MSEIFILDTSAIIGGFRPSPEHRSYTVQEVIDEVKDERSRLLADLELSQNLKILEPSSESLRKVISRSKETGDYIRVSSTDTKVISLALDFKKKGGEPIIVSDDYDVQNLSRDLQIIFQPLVERGIQEVFTWKIVCKACGKEFASDYGKEECNRCGSKISKVVSSRERI
ncbi:MAG: NOB1 family endonuclease [Candidatus Hydrothermarchaeales archaeon]